MIHYYHYSDLSHIVVRHYRSYNGDEGCKLITDRCNLITDTRSGLSHFTENYSFYDSVDEFYNAFIIDKGRHDEASEECGQLYEAGGPYTLLEYAEKWAWPYPLEDKDTITWELLCYIFGSGADFIRVHSGAPKSREATEDDDDDYDSYNPRLYCTVDYDVAPALKRTFKCGDQVLTFRQIKYIYADDTEAQLGLLVHDEADAIHAHDYIIGSFDSLPEDEYDAKCYIQECHSRLGHFELLPSGVWHILY